MLTTRKRTILSAAQKCEICETSSAPSVESIENDRLALQEFLKSYNPEDIWNGDETGLFWKMELSRVLAHDSIFGHKKEKFQITIFYAVNAIGTEKMALSFIHKHKTPHTMKNLNYKNLPVYYFWNKKSWMQYYCKISSPNTNTALQLCDVGIIYSFKCYYKRLIIQNRIDAYNNVQDNIIEKLADYNIFEVLQNSAEAWSMVSSQIIINCWKKNWNSTINIEDEEAELKKLITFLPEGAHLNA
ncbi:hypothetical protein RclHR1_01030018 [Rhizophagus clarus]|uniref:DDE-1 domain-containing protein n=1 Tax=Rhizophagus clarus TaxID=94130 RepID=A0A2Z6Q178_9GLOM|nr:hypothetical protein RclHR1_01030018 [Rhizophagus clarus]